MNWGKIIRWSIVLFLLYCLITYPDAASEVVRRITCEIRAGADQFMTFLARLSAD